MNDHQIQRGHRVKAQELGEDNLSRRKYLFLKQQGTKNHWQMEDHEGEKDRSQGYEKRGKNSEPDRGMQKKRKEKV